YFIHAQDITGSYFVFNAGAAWHYGTTKTTVKSLPIQYLGTKSVVLTLRGTTIEPDGKALPNSEIQIFAKGDDAPTKTVQTDAAAKYTVSIEPGLEYKIVVKHEGYAKTTTNLPLLSNDKKNNG
ncbi:MAG TPA: carboxypeptidase-like regulatory domain-containing protein, partial [Turneriella sp.]|nr:carboxypeptidase-like regulatory domain-containing protein [Turneriella sp.]